MRTALTNPVSRIGRRRGLPACALGLLACSFAVASIPLQPAWAYVDPSVMTYTIQALAGVAVALSAVAGVAFRRTRRTLFRLLKIDENASKIVDVPFRELPGDEGNTALDETFFMDEGEAAAYRAKLDHKEPPLGFAKRFALALVVCFFSAMTVGIAGPVEIAAGAAADIVLTVVDVFAPLALFSTAAAVVLALLVSLLRGKPFLVALALVFAGGLCCYVQSMALNQGLPLADGSAVDWWGDHGTMIALSLAVWIALFAICVTAAVKNGKAMRIGACAVSLALVFVQGVGIGSIFLSKAEEHGAAPIYITQEGLWDVSPNDNVIVLVLDCFDTRTFVELYGEHPEMLDAFDGFTWYRNHSGEMIPTSFAVPYMLTYQAPERDAVMDDYLVERFTNGTFLPQASATGWSIGIYTEGIGLTYLSHRELEESFVSTTENVHEIDQFLLDPKGIVRIFAKASLYRCTPWIAKARFRFYTDDINQACVAIDPMSPAESTPYFIDDAAYYGTLKSRGLSLDDGSAPGSFRFIHLHGAHVPFLLDENAQYVGEGNSDRGRQALGSLKIVEAYFAELKRLGVYDDATIIVTADHGIWTGSMGLPTEPSVPILLYKPKGAAGTPVTTSDDQVGHDNFAATVLEAMGADHGGFGDAYEEVGPEVRARTFYHIRHDEHAHIRGLIEYSIEGDVLDFADWHYVYDWDIDFENFGL